MSVTGLNDQGLSQESELGKTQQHNLGGHYQFSKLFKLCCWGKPTSDKNSTYLGKRHFLIPPHFEEVIIVRSVVRF